MAVLKACVGDRVGKAESDLAIVENGYEAGCTRVPFLKLKPYPPGVVPIELKPLATRNLGRKKIRVELLQ